MASQYQAAGPSRPYHPAHSAHPAHAAHPASAFPIPNMPQQAGWRSPAPERAGLSLGNVGSGSGSGGGGGVAMPTPSVPYARPLPQPTPAPVPASRAPQAASSSSAPLPPLPSPTEETHNPLSDLIETERSYMEQLTLVIRVSQKSFTYWAGEADISACRWCLVSQGLAAAKARRNVPLRRGRLPLQSIVWSSEYDRVNRGQRRRHIYLAEPRRSRYLSIH
jgi:hypothetical protein